MTATNKITEERNVDSFNSIVFKCIGHVHLSQGPVQSVKIVAEPEVAPKIKIEVKNNELQIGTFSLVPFWVISAPTIDFYITVPEIKSLKVTGIGKIFGEGQITGDELHINNSGIGNIVLNVKVNSLHSKLNGIGDIELSGTATMQTIEINGTGKILAFDLESENLQIISKGIGECKVHATKLLDVRLNGIGKIKYKGNPQITTKLSGLGGVEHVD